MLNSYKTETLQHTIHVVVNLKCSPRECEIYGQEMSEKGHNQHRTETPSLLKVRCKKNTKEHSD